MNNQDSISPQEFNNPVIFFWEKQFSLPAVQIFQKSYNKCGQGSQKWHEKKLKSWTEVGPWKHKQVVEQNHENNYKGMKMKL